MTPTRSFLCGCCASALAPVALAARRGHGLSATPPARGRHGAGASRQAVGAKHFVLGTDLGQMGNPTPADGLPMFVTALEAAGITRDQIQTMGRGTPAALLMS
jgi:hypothetical protein